MMSTKVSLCTDIEGEMKQIIEAVLLDNETRERLLDFSVLADFYFEEKLKERRILMIQEQKNQKKQRKYGGQQDIDVIIQNEVLESLKHLPEVIKPEMIKGQ